MKDFLLYVAYGVLLWILFIVFSMPVYSTTDFNAEEIKEFSMKTDVGEIVLTREPCEFTKMGLKDYPYAAYATERNHVSHEGCWTMDVVDKFRAVKLYFPEIDTTAVYNPALFGPRLLIKPTL
jgi:hypothetical protein